MLHPEMVVEMTVQEGPVHVEEHGVDGGPVKNHGTGLLALGAG
jgi:hypothetical protein